MTRQIKVILTEDEFVRLNQIAAQECRRPIDHVRFLIVSALSIYSGEGQNKSVVNVNSGKNSHNAFVSSQP